MNNILDHFATAYFGLYLKGEQDKQAYLDAALEGVQAPHGRRPHARARRADQITGGYQLSAELARAQRQPRAESR